MGTIKITKPPSAPGATLKNSKKSSLVQQPGTAEKSQTSPAINILPPVEIDTNQEDLKKFLFQKVDEKATTSEGTPTDNKKENLKKPTNMNRLGDLIGNASNIVLKAAGILEVEVARGILAAKQVEEKYSNLPKIRGGEITSNRQFDDLFVRFRKDAHDIIDLLVDFTAIAAQNANKVTNQLMKIGVAKSSPTTGSSNQEVPLIQIPGEIKAGQQMSFPITLENDNAKEARTIAFINSPLTSSNGNQLPASALTFNPNPLTINPASTGNVSVHLNIPADAKPGNYNCFVEAQNSENLKATLMVKVV